MVLIRGKGETDGCVRQFLTSDDLECTVPNVPLSSNSALQSWLRRLLAVVIALDLVVAGGISVLHANDSTSPVTADAAVEAFRATRQSTTPTTATSSPLDTGAGGQGTTDNGGGEETEGPDSATPDSSGADGPPPTTAGPADGGDRTSNPIPTPGTPARPAEGVYSYDTSGHERLDALGGARHEYPDQTTLTITHGGCGLRERWQPLDGRYDERSVCATATTHAIEWYESSRSFFGQTDTRRLTCDAGAVAFSTDAPVGTEYRHRCTDPDTDARNVVTVLADEDLVIGGRTVRARRIRSVSDVTGDSRAHSEIDSWVHPETGLTLRRVSLLDGTSTGPSGDVRYHEEYTMQLRSLQPRT